MQHSKFKEIIEGCKCGEKNCDGYLKLVTSQNHYSVGIYHTICTNSINEPKTRNELPNPNYHYKRHTTQIPTDNGDYTCNERLPAAAFVSGSNRTQLNQYLQVLKMPQISPKFYRRFEKPVAEAAEKRGKEEIDTQFTNLCNLPFEKRTLQIDAGHDSARYAQNTTAEGLCTALQHKIAWLKCVHTQSMTGNAWKNEIFAFTEMFDDLVEAEILVSSVGHDDCKPLSKLVAEYNEKMKKLFPDFEGICADDIEGWHGDKASKKALDKLIEEHCKAVKQNKKDLSGNVISKREDQHVIKQKDVARRQLNVVKDRIVKALQQCSHAASGDADLAVDTIREMLYKCLLQDDHSMCEKVCGTDVICSRMKKARDRLSKHIDPDTMSSIALHSEVSFKTLAGGKLDFTDNPYYVRERAERRLERAGFACKRDCTIIDVDAEGSDSDNDSDEDEPVNITTTCTDQFQPVETVLTHPIAISVLHKHLGSKKLETSMRKRIGNQTTAFVESFHSVALIYRPKRNHYHKTHNARIYLAALDWNEIVTRKQIRAKKSGRKRSGNKTYRFIDTVVDTGLGEGWW
jgi:hypothetical protein